MQGSGPDEQRLPDWIITVYTTLEPLVIKRDEGLPADQAIDIMAEEVTEELSLEPGDVEFALQRLLNRGYFYKVDNSLYVTEPGRESADS